MKRLSVVISITAVFMAAILLVLTIAGAGAVPVQETAVVAVELGVHIRYDFAYLNSSPNSPVNITVADSGGSVKATISGSTNGDGDFITFDSVWLPEPPDIMPGDIVTGTVNGSMSVINPVGDIIAQGDLDTDVISGTVHAPWFAPTVDVGCSVWEQGSSTQVKIDKTNIGADGGTFVCDFSGIFDLQRNSIFDIVYFEPDGDKIHSIPLFPWTRVQYGDDWVGADYPAGHLFDLVLKDKDGITKATGQKASTPDDGWGTAGFQTNREDWTPQNFDIVVGDVVHFTSDDGYVHEVKVGEVNGQINYAQNKVTGSLLVPWFSGDLDVECHPWGAPDDIPWPGTLNSSAAADGSSDYACQWNPVDWDIQPGQRVAVGYIEPDDGDFVMNIIVDPAPDIHVEKWPRETDQVDVNGPMVFTIRYRNEGDLPASSVTITDTLPANSTYRTHTGGLAADINAGTVTWESGPLAPGQEEEFYVILEHTASVDDTLTNIVDTYTPNDWQDHNNRAEAEVHVVNGQPDVFIDKWRSSNDPAPGGTFLYQIHYGNNGSVPAGTTFITDTLPAGTTFAGMSSESNYHVWAVTISNGILVFEAPAIPAQWEDNIILRLRVAPDVPLDTQLINEVEIATANDSDLGNNESTHDNTYVRDETWDLRAQKEHRWGTLVPGGVVRYRAEISNDGNMPVMAKLVDTLPEGTTYLETDDYADPVITDGIATWDIGEMLPGEWQDIHFTLAISPTVPVNTVLVNCVEAVMTGDDDDNPRNDSHCVEDMVHEPGPNLHVEKRSWWEGGNSERIHYEITVGNTGTTDLNDVKIIDTYPEGTTFSGDWHSDWDDAYVSVKPGKRELKWTLPQIDSGREGRINFWVDLDGALIGKQGLTFGNLVEAPVPGDVYPQDNTFLQETYSGADLYIKKWVSLGHPTPGMTATFTIEFGNFNDQPWDANDIIIEDTFPDGLKFIEATAPWNPDDTWYPSKVSGDVYTWDWGHIWPDAQLQFDIVVEAENYVDLADILTNEIVIFADNDHDKDPVPENNSATADLTIGYSVMLPAVLGQ